MTGKAADVGKDTIGEIEYQYKNIRAVIHNSWNYTVSVEDVLRRHWDLWKSIQKLLKECQEQVEHGSQRRE